MKKLLIILNLVFLISLFGCDSAANKDEKVAKNSIEGIWVDSSPIKDGSFMFRDGDFVLYDSPKSKKAQCSGIYTIVNDTLKLNVEINLSGNKFDDADFIYQIKNDTLTLKRLGDGNVIKFIRH